eukprot:1186406-Prorocentrum_minimum.AAC.4
MSKPLLSHSTTGKFKFPPKYLRIPRVHVEPYPPHRVRMRCDDDLGCVGFRLTRKGACAGAPHRQPRAAPFHRAQLHEGREGHVKVLGRGQEVAGRDTAPPLLQPPAPHRALPARAGEASHVQEGTCWRPAQRAPPPPRGYTGGPAPRGPASPGRPAATGGSDRMWTRPQRPREGESRRRPPPPPRACAAPSTGPLDPAAAWIRRPSRLPPARASRRREVGGSSDPRSVRGCVQAPKGPQHRLQTANQGVQYKKGVHGLPRCTGYQQP